MLEFVVIVESRADSETATKLAERVLEEKVDWLETDLIPNLFYWSGLEGGTSYSCWRDIKAIVEQAKNSGLSIPKFLGHSKYGSLKADGAATIKILTLIRLLQLKNNRQIRAVLLIRDMDNQPERKQGIEQACLEHVHRQSSETNTQLEMVIGVANRMREAWVLNGFIPQGKEEENRLEEIASQLTFDPCKDSHRLRSNSSEEPDRIRNPKFVLDNLTNSNKQREQQCWEKTDLVDLRERGRNTGLTDYLQEVEEKLSPIITGARF